METALHEAPTPSVVTLSPEAESAIVFWSAPMESMHTQQTVCAITGMAPNTLTNWRSRRPWCGMSRTHTLRPCGCARASLPSFS